MAEDRLLLNLYHSNRQERLADELATLLHAPAGSALDPETVVVQSNGMARWLSLCLADRLGVCANTRFLFPAGFIWEVFRAVLPLVPAASPYEPGPLTWRLLDLLRDLAGGPGFAQVRTYLGDGDELKAYELARRLAETFDQYLVYRPDWIREWEAGGGEGWQPVLWRRLRGQTGPDHWVAVHDAFMAAMDAGGVLAASLPPRVCLFGVPALSPGYLEVLERLAGPIEVHLFLLNPCREYWGDIVPRRDLDRRAAGRDPAALYLETGNALLASTGQRGRDFIDMLQECRAAERDAFVDPGEDSVLHRIQGDILNLRERGGGAPATVAAADDSLQVHACHGPMREAEVLYDRLLALFEAHPELGPADVVVMTPDIEAYAPYIDAVFGSPLAGPSIPYGITDRGPRAGSGVADTFFALLDMPASRFDVSQVMGLLETPSVQARFGLSETDLPLVQRWLRDTGVRWGVDAGSRAELGLPALAENTWHAGLDRLLLGYALPPGESGLFAGIAPYEEIEGGDAQIMGRLLSFATAVFELPDRLAGARSPAAWVDALQALVERFFLATGDAEPEVQALRRALESLGETAAGAGFSGDVGLDLVKAFLSRNLETPGTAGHFLGSGVTFCQMTPMRSVPFPVVCLIGMNDGAFPRSRRAAGFDLMARDFRRGDRSRRDDDRYLLLETLLCARRCLYLSYVGQDIRDNSIIPPSVLVSEVLDYVRQGFVPETGGDMLERILTRHPLQPFSRRYFDGRGGLFSYAESLCQASRAAGSRSAPAPFLAGALPAPEDGEWCRVDLDGLLRFFTNPARHLLQQRLGLRLEEGGEVLDTREPFALDYLHARELRAELLERCLAGQVPAAAEPELRARGLLPHGEVGRVWLGREAAAVQVFAGRLAPLLPETAPAPVEIDLELEGLRLTGWLRDVGPHGLLAFRLDGIKPRDRLDLWLRHLALSCGAPPGVALLSRWIGQDEELLLGPVAEAEVHLGRLLALYRQGLSRPLHFFPKSSYAYARAAADDRQDPLRAAQKLWSGSEHSWGECEDPYFDLALRGADPLDAEFEELALAVFGPLLENLARESA